MLYSCMIIGLYEDNLKTLRDVITNWTYYYQYGGGYRHCGSNYLSYMYILKDKGNGNKYNLIISFKNK